MAVLVQHSVQIPRQQAAGSPLFRWRVRPYFGAVEAIILALYTAVLAITLPYHEPWADEAQSWLIARDNTYWQIFHRRLHYEGSPGLWHVFLRTLHLLHVPWTGVGWCAAVFAVAGVFVWLRWSPLPPILRWLFPFTFFIQYQYAVVARSYILFPLLVFLLCVLYRSRRTGAVAFALVAGLLANLCMQGMVTAGVMSLLYGFERFQQHRISGHRALLARRSILVAALITVGLWGAAIYTATPAADIDFAIGNQISSGLPHRILMAVTGETPSNHPGPIPPDHTPAEWKAIWDAAVPPEPNWRTTPGDWLAWQMRTPMPRRAFSDTVNGILYPIIEIPSELFWALSTFNLAALLFVVALTVWAFRHRVLRYFLPTLALLLVGEFLWTADHHSGMLLVAITAGMWLAATRPERAMRSTSALDYAFVTLGAALFLCQIGWSATSIYMDRTASYDPSHQTASYLHTLPSGTRMVAFHFWAVGIEPYFDHNPFLNMPSSWWQWCSHTIVDAAHRETIAARPDVVVYTYEVPGADNMRNQIIPLNRLTGYEPTDPILLDLREHHYLETHRFCGHRFARWSWPYMVCDVIYEPVQPRIDPRR